jgi:hypothetical protein
VSEITDAQVLKEYREWLKLHIGTIRALKPGQQMRYSEFVSNEALSDACEICLNKLEFFMLKIPKIDKRKKIYR